MSRTDVYVNESTVVLPSPNLYWTDVSKPWLVSSNLSHNLYVSKKRQSASSQRYFVPSSSCYLFGHLNLFWGPRDIAKEILELCVITQI